MKRKEADLQLEKLHAKERDLRKKQEEFKAKHKAMTASFQAIENL